MIQKEAQEKFLKVNYKKKVKREEDKLRGSNMHLIGVPKERQEEKIKKQCLKENVWKLSKIDGRHKYSD